jgi:hypothetical protein
MAISDFVRPNSSPAAEQVEVGHPADEVVLQVTAQYASRLRPQTAGS